MSRARPAKFLRGDDTSILKDLLDNAQWDKAIQRVQEHPEEASQAGDPSPLARVCRYGAPLPCVQAILRAAPDRLRHLLDSRGTPLHEAIVCEAVGADVVAALLEVDEMLGTEISKRATLQQDVDGFTPLHLLIRRRFQGHIMRRDNDTTLMQILELLVRSCPEAIVLPDRGEYEEPPIVYAVKANIYAPALGSDDSTLAKVERQIYEMVACMLRHYPQAASQIFTGYRGQYTALHSAVFHGRFTGTIELLLSAEQAQVSEQRTALLSNTQGELPLHFCCMRGDRPRTIALLSSAAPAAVLHRDVCGLTPLHWLWIRFVSNLMTYESEEEDHETDRIVLEMSRQEPHAKYCEFSMLEQGEFDADLQLINMDPPTDFLRMRHVPVESVHPHDCKRFVDTSVNVLREVRAKYYDMQSTSRMNRESGTMEWSRLDAIVGLFWTKVVALLQASGVASASLPAGDSFLVHAAFATSACPAPVARIVASLFPEELAVPDTRGRFPIHHAAAREWDPLECRPLSHETDGRKLLIMESLHLVRLVMELTPAHCLEASDADGRLPIHHAIESFVNAAIQAQSQQRQFPMEDAVSTLMTMMEIYPDCLVVPDRKTGYVPILQVATTLNSTVIDSSPVDAFLTSLSYEFLRANPSLLNHQQL